MVVSTFNSRSRAEQAVQELRQKGFDQEISIVAKEEAIQGRQDRNQRDMEIGNDLTTGTTTGGVLGGLAGLAAGAGALAIPGLGPLFAAGPIAGLLSGAVTGGIAGGLIDMGIPEAEGKRIEQDIRAGKIMVMVESDSNKIDQANSILSRYGAQEIHTY